MEYSSDEKMTRKEYLKSKRKGKLGLRILKYTLLLVVIALLGVYLFTQLNIYNNVTKIANKVVEESALIRTMKMYYVAEGYTKDSKTDIMIYNSSDNSRVKIKDTQGMNNIQLLEGVLYGIKENKLYSIDLETNQQALVIDQNVNMYQIKGNRIYFYSVDDNENETGIYIYDTQRKKSEKIINIEVNQMIIDNDNIFVISKGKTEKSIIKYNLNGSGRTVISNKEIVVNMAQDKNNLYFISNDKLYEMKKSGKDITLMLEEEIYIDSNIDYTKTIPAAFAVRNKTIYYISKNEEPELVAYDLNTKERRVIDKKNIESLCLVDNILYYKLNDSLEVYKINLETGKGEKVTSIRGNEYICIN